VSNIIFINYQYNKEGRLLENRSLCQGLQKSDKIQYLPTTIQCRCTAMMVADLHADSMFSGEIVRRVKNTDYWVSYSYIDSEREYQNFPNSSHTFFYRKSYTMSIVTKHWIDKLQSQIGFSYTINSGRPYHNPNENTFMNGKTKAYQNLSFNWAYLDVATERYCTFLSPISWVLTMSLGINMQTHRTWMVNIKDVLSVSLQIGLYSWGFSGQSVPIRTKIN
jgi:hypothetical protein